MACSSRLFQLLVSVALLLGAAVPVQAQLFQGRVYRGEVGDENTPIAGVTVALYGGSNPYPDAGVLLRSTTTDSEGWYGLEVTDDDVIYEFFHIREENPVNHWSAGATSVDGTVRDPDWIEFAIPLDVQDLTGNKFWDLTELVDTPTPTATNTRTPTPTRTPTEPDAATPTPTLTPTPEQWEHFFEGEVRAGEPGDDQGSVAGVTVQLWGANNPHPDPGVLLDETFSGDQGQFVLRAGHEQGVWEFYHLLEEDLPGWASSAAESINGVVQTSNWVEFAWPLEGHDLAGNLFWDVPPVEPTPTPTPTPTGAPTSTPTPTSTGAPTATPTPTATPDAEWNVVLSGELLAGEPGSGAPLPGVEVTVYGSMNPYPDLGEHLRSTTSEAGGWFELPVSSADGQWEFYHLVETNLDGWESVAADSPGGQVQTPDWIQFAGSLPGLILEDNRFWDVELVNSPTPTPTPTLTPTVTPTPGGPMVLTICAVEDATVDEANPSSNDGYSSELRVGFGQGAGEPYATRTLLRFDLSFIPPDAQILDARLEMGLKSGDGVTPVGLEIMQVAAGWSESTVTWVNQPPTTAPAAASEQVPSGAVGHAIPWNVTGLVQQWIADPGMNFGVAVRGPESGSQWRRVFESRHYTAFCPQLTVEIGPDHVVPTPTPTSTPTPTPTPTAVCAQPDEAGDSFAGAGALDLFQAKTAYICPSGDEDWWSFSAGSGAEINAWLYNMPADLNLTLVNPSGSGVTTSQRWGAANDEYIRYTADASGTWALVATGRTAADWSPGSSYSIRAEVCADSISTDAGNTFATADPITPSVSGLSSNVIHGWICPPGDEDWYRFDVPATQGTSIDVKLSNLPASYNVHLVRPDGIKAVYGSSPGTADVTITHTPAMTGSWRVQVIGTYVSGSSQTTFDNVLPYQLEVTLTSTNDLVASELEVTQAIQRLTNSVPLVAGKSTLARFFAIVNGPATSVAGVDAELYGWTDCNGCTPLPGSPLKISNRAVDYGPAGIARLRFYHNFNFYLPPAWHQPGKTIYLQARVNPDLSVPESSSANNTINATASWVSRKPMHVMLVPVQASGLTPSWSDPNMSAMISWMRAAIPAGQIQVWQKSGGPLVANYDYTSTSGGCGKGWSQLVSDMETLWHSWSSRPSNAYIYGLVHPSVPHQYSGCGRRPGIGAAGILDSDSGSTIVHELGHNMGRRHAPSDRDSSGNVTDPNCGNPANEDGSYPQYADHLGHDYPRASIGDVGVNVPATSCWPPPCARDQVFHPHGTYDVMSYCRPRWMSLYTYTAMMNHLPAKATDSTDAASPHLLVTGDLVGGDLQLTTPLWVLDSAPQSPPDSADLTIELVDSSGHILVQQPLANVDPFHADNPEDGRIHQLIPWDPATARVEVLRDDDVVASVDASDHPPEVTVTSPGAGDSWDTDGTTTRTISWNAHDPDGDKLHAIVRFSPDNGATWTPLDVNITESSLEVDSASVAGTDSGVVEVRVTDGLLTAVDQSDGTFHVAAKPPLPFVVQPAPLDLIPEGASLVLDGSAWDPEDGAVDPEQLSWSAAGDSLGSGGHVVVDEPLPCGPQDIVFNATDSQKSEGGTTVTVVSLSGCDKQLALVPAGAHSPGAAGTSWVTDLVLHNPTETAATAVLYLLPRAADEVREPYAVDLGSNRSVRLADVIASVFGHASTSAAVLAVSSQDMIVSSRTFNTADSGTFGQYIPGYRSAEAVPAGDAAHLVQLTRTGDFRTNIGLANPNAQELPVTISLRAADGTDLGEQSFVVPAFSFHQANDILSGAGSVADARAIVLSGDPSLRFHTYASVVDNHSGDPIYVAPAAASKESVIVAAAAHAPGVNNTLWRTDLEVCSVGSGESVYRIELLAADSDNSNPPLEQFTLEAGRCMRYGDVVGRFGVNGSGALRVTAEAGEIMVSSRTYNDLGDKTYGQYIPGVPAATAGLHEQSVRLVQLAYSPSQSSGFRTNVGTVNLGSSEISVTVDLYAGNGTILGTRTITLPPYAYHQENNIFSHVTSSSLEDGFAVLSSSDEGARFLAYASVVDNRSGDPVFIPAR